MNIAPQLPTPQYKYLFLIITNGFKMPRLAKRQKHQQFQYSIPSVNYDSGLLSQTRFKILGFEERRVISGVD